MIQSRIDGPVTTRVEDVTDRSMEPRRIFIVQTTEDPPQMRESVRALEDARRKAEEGMQRKRSETND